MQIELKTLKEIISQTTFLSTGAITEKQYSHHLRTDFSNFENFWKTLIVPFTNRIPSLHVNIDGFTDPREGVSEDLQEIGSFHYSIFLNLVYAHRAIEEKHFSFFENFYMHLGSVCDLVEEFLIQVYFLICECKKIESEILTKLTKDQFLELAGNWYDENYINLFEIYFKNGRANSIKLPNRKYVLQEYFGKSKEWKAYVKFSQAIRQYRNVVVHHYKIAFLQDEQGRQYVPKKETLSKYKKWYDVIKASHDSNKHSDFILQDSLMIQDIKELKQILQNLWHKPITDVSDLLFESKNEILLKKYNMTYI